jgi:hypothetical protein
VETTGLVNQPRRDENKDRNPSSEETGINKERKDRLI